MVAVAGAGAAGRTESNTVSVMEGGKPRKASETKQVTVLVRCRVARNGEDGTERLIGGMRPKRTQERRARPEDERVVFED